MKKVCATGPGSARPVVSMMTRSNSSSPLRRLAARSLRVVRRSSRIEQQTQPLFIWMICSVVSTDRMSVSMSSSPNSFSITAIFWPWASVSTRLSRVVLPEPRKPVRMVAGIRPVDMMRGAAALWETRPQMGAMDCVASAAPSQSVILQASQLRHACPVSEPQPGRPSHRGGQKHTAEPRGLLDRMLEFLHPGPDSKSELMETLADAEQRELIEPESREMLEAVLRMAELSAGDVMVAAPRMDLLDIEAPYDELLNLVIGAGHSRFPVFEGQRDNIIGILLAKDLLKIQRAPELNLRALLRPAVFVPESKGLNELLRDFRSNRNHLAIVIDEFGNTAGLITIEDVLEEIVGEIEDEFDDKDGESSIYTLADGSQRVAGDATIAAVNQAFSVDLSEQAFDTIGGLVAQEHGPM